jgi:hypothetical protein
MGLILKNFLRRNIFEVLFPRSTEIFKQIFRGTQLDTVSEGSSENYALVGSGDQQNFSKIGVMGESGVFQNLIVNVGANGTGTIVPDAHVGIGISGGVTDLVLFYGNAETGTKTNNQNTYHASKGERVGIQILGGEGGTTISQVSWSVDFIPDQI